MWSAKIYSNSWKKRGDHLGLGAGAAGPRHSGCDRKSNRREARRNRHRLYRGRGSGGLRCTKGTEAMGRADGPKARRRAARCLPPVACTLHRDRRAARSGDGFNTGKGAVGGPGDRPRVLGSGRAWQPAAGRFDRHLGRRTTKFGAADSAWGRRHHHAVEFTVDLGCSGGRTRSGNGQRSDPQARRADTDHRRRDLRPAARKSWPPERTVPCSARRCRDR